MYFCEKCKKCSGGDSFGYVLRWFGSLLEVVCPLVFRYACLSLLHGLTWQAAATATGAGGGPAAPKKRAKKGGGGADAAAAHARAMSCFSNS